MQTNTSGKRWARAGLIFGAALSVLGNVAHTVLATSPVSLWLRIPFAVVWPVALFVGIEVLVRVDWRRKMIDLLGRLLLVVPVSVVAAVVSYLHLHSLMILAAEDDFSALVGPLAIDGLMLGSTVALLAIRAASLAAPADVPRLLDEPLPISDQELEAIERDWNTAELDIAAPPAERKPRAPKTATTDAVAFLLDGLTVKEAAEKSGVGRSTVQRYGTVLRTLLDNPHAPIDAKQSGVLPALVDTIREHARAAAVR